MIQLDKYEKQWILLIKGQLQEKYPFTGEWTENLKPLFIEIYGCNPGENYDYHDYLKIIFNKLLDILLKIKEDQSNTNLQLKAVFHASFDKSIRNDYRLPIERAISTLCGLIQWTSVINLDGTQRFELS